jgi:DNA-directed RNA polymerase specialized sigma subunit
MKARCTMAEPAFDRETRLEPYSPPQPATEAQIKAEMRLFRRKAVRRLTERYLKLLLKIGNPSSWEFLEDLAVVGFLRQHRPPRRSCDDDIIFYIDFQSALWQLDPRLRVTFALRYIWDMTDDEIAHFLSCARRTVLRLADRLNDQLYALLRDYYITRERELMDILMCRF